jgi:hypothetical protein
MQPHEIKQKLAPCVTHVDLEIAVSEMSLADIEFIIDTFTIFSQLSELTMRDAYILNHAKWAYDKMVGNLRDLGEVPLKKDPVICKQQ